MVVISPDGSVVSPLQDIGIIIERNGPPTGI